MEATGSGLEATLARLEATLARLEAVRGDIVAKHGGLEAKRQGLGATRRRLEAVRGGLEAKRWGLEDAHSALEAISLFCRTMITLVLAFHNHQPIGNFDWVIEDAYQRAYRPLLDLLERYPTIRFAQHYTGILLDWFDRNHPDVLDVIGKGVIEGRIELISGGYYEPILAMLPERDRIAQIEKLNRRIAGEFGGDYRALGVVRSLLPMRVHGRRHIGRIGKCRCGFGAGGPIRPAVEPRTRRVQPDGSINRPGPLGVVRSAPG